MSVSRVVLQAVAVMSQTFLTALEARKHYTAALPTHIQVVVVLHATENERMPMKVESAKLTSECFYIVAFNPKTCTALPWGYIDRMSFGHMSKNEIAPKELLIFRKHCTSIPRSSSNAAALKSIQVNTRFRGYTSPPPGEASITDITDAIVKRFLLYKSFDRENELMTLCTDQLLRLDQVSYWFIITALYHPYLRQHDPKKHFYLVKRVMEFENTISKLRVELMHPGHIMRLVDDECTMVDTVGIDGFDTMYPNERQCFSLPFEKAAALLSKRKVLLKAGYAYVHPMHLNSIALREIQVQHEKNVIRIAEKAPELLPKLMKHEHLNHIILGLIQHMSTLTQADVGLTANVKHTSDQIGRYAPPCVQYLLNKAYNVNDIKNYLKNQDRTKLAIFLLQNGIPKDVIASGWEVKMRKVYTVNNIESQLKQLNGTLTWAERRKAANPLTCGQMIGDNCCPFAKQPDQQGCCTSSLARKLDKVLDLKIQHPAHYIAVAIENVKQ